MRSETGLVKDRLRIKVNLTMARKVTERDWWRSRLEVEGKGRGME